MTRLFSDQSETRSSWAALPLGNVLAIATSAANDELMPPDASTEIPPLVVTLAPNLFHWLPFVAAAVALAVSLGLHYRRSREMARNWSGVDGDWPAYWLGPVVAALITFSAVCGGFVVYGCVASVEFRNHVFTAFTLTDAALLVVALAICFAPAVWCRLRPRENQLA